MEMDFHSSVDNVISEYDGYDLSGGGGKGGGSAASGKEAPNTGRSKAVAKFIELLGEGEIVGLVDGAKSIILNKVAVENPDGSQNHKGLSYALRTGTPDQEPIPNMEGVTSEYEVNLRVRNDTPVTYRTAAVGLDSVIVTLQIPNLTKLDTKTGSLDGYYVDIAIDIRSTAPGSSWVTKVQNDHINHKNTAPYERSYRIQLPENDPGPWLIRMRRVSPDVDNDSSIQNLTFFSRVTEIFEHKVAYADSAVIGIEIDAEQFGNGLPQRQFDIYGKKINYPSNYDPETRTYNGFWDGTWSYGYCNCPPWVMMDVMQNPRYGLNIPDNYIDKWGLYELAKFCDVMVPDGLGGTEPRFVFNGTFYNQQSAYKVLQEIASMMRAIVFYSAGAIMVRQDKPKFPDQKIFTKANIIGDFNYPSTAKRARHTACIVEWQNPELGYEKDYAVYKDRKAILKYGYNPLRIVGVGTKSIGQAYRQAKWAVLTEQLQTETVIFETAFEGADVLPGDLIEIADPHKAETDFAGRILVGNGRNLYTSASVSSWTAANAALMSEYEAGPLGGRNLRQLKANAGTGVPKITGANVSISAGVHRATMTVQRGTARYVGVGVQQAGATAMAMVDLQKLRVVSKSPTCVNPKAYVNTDGSINVSFTFTAASGNAAMFGFIGEASGRTLAPEGTTLLANHSFTGNETAYFGLPQITQGNRKYPFTLPALAANQIAIDRDIDFETASSPAMHLTLLDGPIDDVANVNNDGRPNKRKLRFFSSGIVSYDPLTQVATLLNNVPSGGLDNLTPVVWAFSSEEVAPKPFVVITNEETDEGTYKIAALEYSAEKFVLMDEDYDITYDPDQSFSDLPSTAYCAPISELRADLSYKYGSGGPKIGVALSWKDSPDSFVRYYNIGYKRRDDNWQYIEKVYNNFYEFEDMPEGEYIFSVRAVNVFGNSSEERTVGISVTEASASGREIITSLYTDLGTSTFKDKDIRLSWASNAPSMDIRTPSVYLEVKNAAGTITNDAPGGGLLVQGGAPALTNSIGVVNVEDVNAVGLTLTGTIAPNDQVVATIGTQQIAIVAASNSLNNVAEQLRAAIDADPKYTAVRTNATVTVGFAQGQTNADDLSAHNDPLFQRYRVRVYNPDNDELLRTEYTETPFYTYEFATNKEDFGGDASRSVRFRVDVQDIYGNYSLAKTGTFTNAAPVPTAVTFDAKPDSVNMLFTPPDDADYDGVELYLSPIDGFTPSEANLVFRDRGNPSIPVSPGQTFYARYRFFDRFGMSGVAFSSQRTIVVPRIDAANVIIGGGTSVADEVQGIKDDITDLFTTYGDTQSAAISAQDAANAAITAALAATNSEAARLASETARDASVDAQLASEAAQNNAQTANTLAQAAKDAAQAQANTALLQAQAAAGSASTAAGHASTSATNASQASGSASAAAASALVATSRAGEAANSASAANISAQSASTSATQAGNFASAANTSLVSAQIAASVIAPSTFREGGTYFSFLYGDEETALRPEQAFNTYSYPVTSDFGRVLRTSNLVGYGHVTLRRRIRKAEHSRRFRLVVRGRQVVNPAQGNAILVAAIYGMGDNWQTICYGGWEDVYNDTNGLAQLNVAAGVVTASCEFSLTATPGLDPLGNVPTDGVIVGCYVVNQANPGVWDSGVADIISLELSDVTEQHNAQQSAAASASSAATAAASESNAVQQASAAQQSANTATTKASEASTSANQAATSASGAAGSSATASSQASLAATARNAAQVASQATVPDNFIDPNNWVSYNDWGGSLLIGNGIASTYNGGSIVGKFHLPLVASQRYRLTMRHRVVNQGGGEFYLGVRTFPSLTVQWVYSAPSGPVGQWQTTTVEFAGSDIGYPNETGISPQALIGYANASDGEISMFRLENITSQFQSAQSASASLTHSQNAAAASDAAGSSANAAQASRLAAEAANGTAQTAASNASASSSAADAHRASAANSASLSAAFSNTRGITPNGNFAAGIQEWTDLNNNIEAVASFDGRSGLIRNKSGGSVSAMIGRLINIDTSRKFRLRCRLRVATGGNTPVIFYIGFGGFDAGQNYLTHHDGTYNYPVIAGTGITQNEGWRDFISPVITGEGHGSLLFPVGTRFATPVFYGDYTNTGNTFYLDELYLEDVTESTDAQTAANVSTSSAATAGTHASTAQTNANLAATYRDQADGHRASALSSASAASGSAASAAGSASSAASQATLAATYSADAGNAAASAFPRVITATSHSPGGEGLGRYPAPFPSLVENGTINLPATGGVHALWMREAVPFELGKTYRIYWEWIQNAGSIGAYGGAYIRFLNSNFEYLADVWPTSGGNAGGTALRTPVEWEKQSADINLGNWFPPNAAFVRFGLLVNRNTAWTPLSDTSTRVRSLYAEDITSRQAAAASASAAAGSATSASADAASAASNANLAVTYRNQAEGHANSAATQAGAAANSAAVADSHRASAASSASLSATYRDQSNAAYQNNVLVDGNLDFSQGLEAWTLAGVGITAPAVTPGGYVGVAWGVGKFFWIVPNGQQAEMYSRKSFEVNTSRRYEFKADFGTWGSPGQQSQFYIGFVGLDGDGNPLDHGAHGTWRYAVATGEIVPHGSLIQNRRVVVTGEGNDAWTKFPPGTKRVRLFLLVNYAPGTGTIGTPSAYVGPLEITDVTDRDAAASSASAAASSAAVADGHQSSAASSASLAATYRDQAAGSASGASSSASAASGSAATAAGHASTAQAQASLSASYRTGAAVAAAESFPSTFDNEGEYFSFLGGSETTAFRVHEAYGYGSVITYPVREIGRVMRITYSPGYTHITTRKRIPRASNRRYRITARCQVLVNGPLGFNYVVATCYGLTQDYQTVTYDGVSYAASPGGMPQTAMANTSFSIFEVGIDFWSGSTSSGTVWIVPGIYVVGHNGVSTAGETGVVDVISLKIEDVTDSVRATTQADIATTQAASANSQRALAETAANLSASYRDQALGHANTASSQAGVATSQAAIATSAASAARATSSLVARLNTGTINPNPGLLDWDPSIWAWPNHWAEWTGGAPQRIADSIGDYRARFICNENQEQGMAQYEVGELGNVTPGKHVIEVATSIVNGPVSGAGILVYWFNASSQVIGQSTIAFHSDRDITDAEPSVWWNVGQIKRFSKVITAPEGTRMGRVYAMSNWGGFGSAMSPKTIDFHYVGLKPAGTADAGFGDLRASVTVAQGAIAAIQGAAAYYETIVAASGSNPAIVRLKAGNGGSAVGLAADSISLQNYSNGQLVDVARFVNGVAQFNDAMVRRLRVAPRSNSSIYLPVMLRPLVRIGSDGQTIQYQNGASFGAQPERIVPDLNGLPALAPGESYDVRALNITDTGFTAYAKKITASEPVAAQSSAGVNVGGLPQWRAEKPSALDAYNGNYQFTINIIGQLLSSEPAPGGAIYEWAASGDLYIADINGNMVKVGSYNEFWGGFNVFSSRTITVTVNNSMAVGSGGYKFGVHPTGGGVSGFSGVFYATQVQTNVSSLSAPISWVISPPLPDE